MTEKQVIEARLCLRALIAAIDDSKIKSWQTALRRERDFSHLAPLFYSLKSLRFAHCR